MTNGIGARKIRRLCYRLADSDSFLIKPTPSNLRPAAPDRDAVNNAEPAREEARRDLSPPIPIGAVHTPAWVLCASLPFQQRRLDSPISFSPVSGPPS